MSTNTYFNPLSTDEAIARMRAQLDAATDRAALAALYADWIGYDPTQDNPSTTDEDMREILTDYIGEVEIDAESKVLQELREERDAAIARVAELEAAIQRAMLTIADVNALPEANGWWPAGESPRIARLALAVSRATVERALGNVAACAPAK